MGWIQAGNTDILAVHAALLPTGKILFFGGSDYNVLNSLQNIRHSAVFDCATMQITPLNSPSTDTFCCGHTQIGRGRLVIAGGTSYYPGQSQGEEQQLIHEGAHHWSGIREVWSFDAVFQTWKQLSSMNPAPPTDRTSDGAGGGRWYPTLVTLASGQVLAVGGHPNGSDKRHCNNIPETYSPEFDIWTMHGELGDPETLIVYPRMHVLPDGDVFCVTPHDFTNQQHFPQSKLFSFRYNPVTQTHRFVGNEITNPDYQAENIAAGYNTTSVLLPYTSSFNYHSRVLLCGSNQPLKIDLDAPSPIWEKAGTRPLLYDQTPPKRYNLNAVLLPTGDVMVSGGTYDTTRLDTTGVREVEIYNPETEDWVALESEWVTRNYHSVALLMPDGRVWTAGSNIDARHGDAAHPDTHQPLIEIYEPFYCYQDRPQIIDAPAGFLYRNSPHEDFAYKIHTPQSAAINRVALVRTGSATHAFNSDQRYIELEFQESAPGELSVTPPPPGGIAPPGDYLLFIVNDQRVPSVGKFVTVGSPPYTPGAGSGFSASSLPGSVDVFWIRSDGKVLNNARYPTLNSGNWNNPISITPFPGSADVRSGVTAVSSEPGAIDVFWIRPDGMVFVNARNPHYNQGNWNNPIPIAPNPGSADPRSGVAAVSRMPGAIDVFWVRPDGMVFVNARNPGFNNGNWNNPIPIAPNPGSADPRSGVAAVSSLPGSVDVFWVRADGIVFNNSLYPNLNNGNWNNPIPIAPNPGSADPRSGVAAVSREPGAIDVFWVRPDGMVFVNARNPHFNSGNWNNPIPITPNPGSADPRSGVAAISRVFSTIDIFWVTPHGSVMWSYLNPYIHQGSWSAPVSISPDGSADPASPVTAISRGVNAVDVFWVSPGGAMMTIFADPNFNRGNWNGPIEIAVAGSAVTGVG